MVLVIANGQPPSSSLLYRLAQKHNYIVAVDGGLHACLKSGIKPHLIIGDFDSISQSLRTQCSDILQIYTPDQNRSDLEKTFDLLFQKGESHLTVCGALGKRIDHTMTNICLLCRYPGMVTFETERETCFALPKTAIIECQKGQILSLIPASSEVTEVVSKGLKWELQNVILNKFLFSISNVCLHDSVTISFNKGDLVVCLVHSS